MLGETVVVENRAGAAGSIGARACADAPPDGYTICILNGESMVINPLIFKNMSFDPRKDLVHVTRLFYLHAGVRGELVARREDRSPNLRRYAKAKPKTHELHGAVAVEGRVHGGVQQAARHRLRPRAVQGRRRRDQQHDDRHHAGRDLRHRQSHAVSSATDKIVGLAVDGDTRSPLAPDIPTFRELGYTRPRHGGVLRHPRAGRHAEADRRPV